MSADQYIESAKQGLINASDYLKTSNWRAGISAVRTCIGYVDTSGIMHDNNRLEERLWILKMVQQFAYHDQDAGGIREFSNWCELQYNNILCYYPGHVQALQGRAHVYLLIQNIHTNQVNHNRAGTSLAVKGTVLAITGLQRGSQRRRR